MTLYIYRQFRTLPFYVRFKCMYLVATYIHTFLQWYILYSKLANYVITYSSENWSNELVLIRSSGYDEVPSCVLLVTKAKLEVNLFSSDSVGFSVRAIRYKMYIQSYFKRITTNKHRISTIICIYLYKIYIKYWGN